MNLEHIITRKIEKGKLMDPEKSGEKAPEKGPSGSESKSQYKSGSHRIEDRSKIRFHQKAIILNKKGKFLAIKASYKGLKWDLPGGGVEFPEIHEDSLRREIKEETQIQVKELNPVSVETGHDNENDLYFLFIGYITDFKSGKVKLSSEHTEYKWVTKDEFIILEATQYLKEFVKKVLK